MRPVCGEEGAAEPPPFFSPGFHPDALFWLLKECDKRQPPDPAGLFFLTGIKIGHIFTFCIVDTGDTIGWTEDGGTG